LPCASAKGKFDAENREMRMAATWIAAAAMVMSLAGSEWGPDGGSGQTLQFDGQKVTGHAGCNRFFGPYTQQGERLAMGPIGSTRKLCDGAHNALERSWFAMIARTREIEASHLLLILKDGDGRVLARLQRRDFD
jgi:META domain